MEGSSGGMSWAAAEAVKKTKNLSNEVCVPVETRPDFRTEKHYF